MIKIAICDDQQIMRAEIIKRLSEYRIKRNVDVQIYEYENGTRLLEDEKEYDLVFLDYEFKNDARNDGLSIAKRLREKQQNLTIIFLSSHNDIVCDSFSVGTFRFLLKPIDAEKFIKAMDDYLETLKKDSVLIVKVEGSNRILHTNEITYIEGAGKYCVIHLVSGEEIEGRETLSSVEERLSEEFFYRCHKSFVVGYAFVDAYNRTSIELTTGDKVDIGRGKYKEFTGQYLEYLSRYC